MSGAPPASERARRRPSVLLALVGGLAVLSWCAGFLWFQAEAQRLPPPPPPHVDGIVALTGGAGRVQLALHALADGGADKLLVTGIGGNADRAALAHLAGMNLAPLADRITLGHYAASTRGNAVETAAWATQNGIHSLVVVTSALHMPRALAELRESLPDARLYPLPVEAVVPDDAEGRSTTLSLRARAEEFTKYLLVVSGLSPWFPHREAALAAGANG
jgi:uncharacterized SAM-binding protein YcdF (DUF218 family)